ncbi:MAG: hypothetical protein K0R77_2063 [Chryseobacterium sp.]|jgi:hypothetical protein|uniref:hypothetical protein n=1 Tax=Chryseobacterium sp. TaxID=1871047 RepID=UPI0026395094|nr:hypothetical protein [Chryseobacterium sp.]MDF2552788.1 hypothetical protein [Chryseobacterium sp.]
MEEKLQQLKEKFPNIVIEKKDNPFYEKFEDENKFLFYVNGFTGNPDLKINVGDDERLERLHHFLEQELFVYPDFVAVKKENTIEVLLSTIGFKPYRLYEREDDSENTIIEIGMFYNKNDLNITIEVDNAQGNITKLLEIVPGGARHTKKTIFLKINNFIKSSNEGIINDTRNIINSVLFDIEFSYGIAFETVNIDSLIRRLVRKRQKFNEIPSEKINLVFKKYIPELIQYFHLAEKVDYLPFKFICYYHILEYFSDKSAYNIVSKEVKKLLLKPDFHIKTDQYVNTAINIFKKENDKYTGDKVKVERVLRQFIDREDLKETLLNIEKLNYFSEEVTIDCIKPLKLPAINFDQDGNFYGELTKRIYSLRCSIVHSNPDFDESKAVPFSPTSSNLHKLKIEIEMIAEIAKKIIINSKEI